ncbi:hypothetical protein [Sphingomonas antarctica]|uniref:PAS domain-containing protein n=1 Tax=Sphingomonas antarctica TaxID=2040274 RepID=UPI0039E831CE
MEQLPVLGGTPVEDVLDLVDAIDPPPAIDSSDERRMHVRAYNHWVSLLRGRQFPPIENLDAAGNRDFGAHSVLLDFSRGVDAPSIAFLGAALARECDFDAGAHDLCDVPPRSLLSRLTDHYMQIIANRAPVGFEAEFQSAAGQQTAYRGILMPFSSDDETIDFIFGVINWKEVAPAAEAMAVHAELDAHVQAEAAPRVPAWRDGPHANVAVPEPLVLVEAMEDPEPVSDDLADWLAYARTSADAVKQADGRSRAALYHALGHAYDFALLADAQPGTFAEMLSDAGIKVQARAPMTPVVKLIFGADYDKTRLTEFAAALTFGKRNGLLKGGMARFLEYFPGGLKAIVGAERRERRPEGTLRQDRFREAARKIATQEVFVLPGDDEFVVLVARRIDPERVGIIGAAPEDQPLIDRALKYVAAAELAAAAG